MAAHQSLHTLEEVIGHHFASPELLEMARTHPSAVEGSRVELSYERLEFLGDSILGAMVATDIYEAYPNLNEGELTKIKVSLVSGETLSEVAESLGLGDYIVFGESERGTGSRGMHSALENVYEAIVGALYLDAGYRAAHDFVRRTVEPRMGQVIPQRLPDSPKSILQEVTQRDMRCAPVYKIVNSTGPAHSPTFTAVVSVMGRRVGRGEGSSKKEAEAKAAAHALTELGYGEAIPGLDGDDLASTAV